VRPALLAELALKQVLMPSALLWLPRAPPHHS
jgi:hypothetical protein